MTLYILVYVLLIGLFYSNCTLKKKILGSNCLYNSVSFYMIFLKHFPTSLEVLLRIMLVAVYPILGVYCNQKLWMTAEIHIPSGSE